MSGYTVFGYYAFAPTRESLDEEDSPPPLSRAAIDFALRELSRPRDSSLDAIGIRGKTDSALHSFEKISSATSSALSRHRVSTSAAMAITDVILNYFGLVDLCTKLNHLCKTN